MLLPSLRNVILRGFTQQLQVLQSLLETDKAFVPAVIRLQDRGKLNLPHRILLPLMKRCSVAIKSKINVQMFQRYGYEMVKVHTSMHL